MDVQVSPIALTMRLDEESILVPMKQTAQNMCVIRNL